MPSAQGPSEHAKRVKHLREMQGGNADEEALLNGEIEDYGRHETEAHGSTFLAVYVDGRIGYHKRHDLIKENTAANFGQNKNTPPMHECAAWQLAKRLDKPYSLLVPPTVYRRIEGFWGSVSQGMPGNKPPAITYPEAAEQIDAGAFFDALIGNQDRHLNNYLWDATSKRLSLIDHGFAFPAGTTGADHVKNWFLMKRRRNNGHIALTKEEIELVDKILASGDLYGLTPLLEPPRAKEMERRLKLMQSSKLIPKFR